MFRWDMNVEQARKVPHAAHDSLFAITEQLQLPHTAVCWAVKLDYQLSASWLISLCGFCLCGIRRWKSHVWCFLETRVFNLLQGCLVERAGPIPWPGRSCDFTLLDFFWSNVTEHIYIYIFHHLSFSCWKYTEIEHVLSHAIFWYCAQYKVVIPFWHFGITNWSCLQGSRCSSRTCLGSRQLARTGCLLEELTVTERTIGSWFSGET